MNRKVSCDRCREQIPMLFAGKLDERERDQLAAHLAKEPGCRSLFRQERALFLAAGCDKDGTLLSEASTSDLMARYAVAPERLDAIQREAVEAYLSRSEVGRDLIAMITKLPGELDDMLSSQAIPLISSLDAAARQPRLGARMTSLARRIVWHPAVAYASAAAVVLLVLLRPLGTDESAPSRVAITLSGPTRGASADATVSSATRQCYVDLSYFIDPEPGHQYDFSVSELENSSHILFWEDYSDFDRRGYAHLSALLEAGDYRLVVHDIVDRDTIEVASYFTIEVRDR